MCCRGEHQFARSVCLLRSQQNSGHFDFGAALPRAIPRGVAALTAKASHCSNVIALTERHRDPFSSYSTRNIAVVPGDTIAPVARDMVALFPRHDRPCSP